MSRIPLPGRLYEAAIDHILHRVAVPRPGPVRPEVAEFHRSIPVVDLLVGTALFHRDLLAARRGGHVDLARLIEGGVDLVGLSIATRFPDLRGTLSAPHLLMLGLPAAGGQVGLVEALVRRIEGWEAQAGGGFRIVRSRQDLDGVGRGSWVGGFIGVQGGHVLDGEAARRPHRLRA